MHLVVEDPGDLLMSWFPWNLIAHLGSGWLTVPGASETKTLKLRLEATKELYVVATKTSLQLEPGKSTGSIPVLRMSLVQETVGPTVQETSAQARPLRKGDFSVQLLDLETGGKSKASLLLTWNDLSQNSCCWLPAQSQHLVCEQEALLCAYQVGPQSNILGDEDVLSK